MSNTGLAQSKKMELITGPNPTDFLGESYRNRTCLKTISIYAGRKGEAAILQNRKSRSLP
jgi:hypothetical protein